MIFMAHQAIVNVGESAAVLLPQEFLEQMNVHIGDEVDLSMMDHVLILRSLEEVRRQQQLDMVTKEVFTRRKSAYQRLAQGE